MFEELKQKVYEANMELPQRGLVTYTWGNVSGIDREKGLFVIKPSGVDYDVLKPSDLVVMDLQGNRVEGTMNPSSDMLTHMVLYNAFPEIDGNTADVMPTEPLDKKLEAFNWHVIKIDGHNYDQILSALAEARNTKGMPTAILMKTVKGKGVSYMENNAGWHGKAPNADEFAIAKAELEAKIKELEEN